MQMQTNKMK